MGRSKTSLLKLPDTPAHNSERRVLSPPLAFLTLAVYVAGCSLQCRCGENRYIHCCRLHVAAYSGRENSRRVWICDVFALWQKHHGASRRTVRFYPWSSRGSYSRWVYWNTREWTQSTRQEAYGSQCKYRYIPNGFPPILPIIWVMDGNMGSLQDFGKLPTSRTLPTTQR